MNDEKSKISCTIRCMNPADVHAGIKRLDPGGFEWVSYTCQISGEKENVLIISDQLALKLLNNLEAKSIKDVKILAGLYASELCECDIATLTTLPESEVLTRLNQLLKSGTVSLRKIHKMNYFKLASEEIRHLISKTIRADL